MLHPFDSKEKVRKTIKNFLVDLGLEIAGEDFSRPWGGFFKISENQIDKFIRTFFPKEQIDQLNQKLSPKILVVAPSARLSWQYHFRRKEVWRIVHGPVGVVRSKTNVLESEVSHEAETIIRIDQEERHRLVGQNNWGVVAEIWSHIDVNRLSDEEDIVRLEDDYHRN